MTGALSVQEFTNAQDLSQSNSPWIYDFIPAACFDFTLYCSFFVIQQFFESHRASSQDLALNQAAYSGGYILFCPLIAVLAFKSLRGSILTGIFGSMSVMVVLVWANDFWHFQVLLACLALFAAFFWTNLQKLIGSEAGESQLGQRVNIFNLGWTTGKASGLVIAGWLVQQQLFRATFVILAALQFANACICLTRKNIRPENDEKQFVDNDRESESASGSQALSEPEEHSTFVQSRWLFLAVLIVNLLAWGSQATFIALIPVIGKSMALSAWQQGLLLGLLVASQGLSFMTLKLTRIWIGKILFVLLPAIGLGLCWGVLSLKPSIFIVFATAALIGMNVALSYSNSIFYALSVGKADSWRANIHEATLGVASLGLPYIAGLILLTENFESVCKLMAAVALGICICSLVTSMYAKQKLQVSN